MNIEEIKRNTFIANLSGIAEHFNEQEIKCDIKSNMTVTIQLMDNANIDIILRFYRKDKSIFSYTEYKDDKRHGKAKTFRQNGKLRSYTLLNRGNMVTSKSFDPDGKLSEDKHYRKGKLHGECKYYYIGGTSLVRTMNTGVDQYSVQFYSNGMKSKEEFYNRDGSLIKTILYDEKEKLISVRNWYGWF